MRSILLGTYPRHLSISALPRTRLHTVVHLAVQRHVHVKWWTVLAHSNAEICPKRFILEACRRAKSRVHNGDIDVGESTM